MTRPEKPSRKKPAARTKKAQRRAPVGETKRDSRTEEAVEAAVTSWRNDIHQHASAGLRALRDQISASSRGATSSRRAGRREDAVLRVIEELERDLDEMTGERSEPD